MHPSDSVLLQLMLAYLFVLMVPGSIMITTATLAATDGIRRTVPFVVGASVGTGGIVMAVGAAISHSHVTVPVATLHQVGSVALVGLAFMILKNRNNPTGAVSRDVPCLPLVIGGIAAALSSPMTSVFAANLFVNQGPSLPAPLITALAVAVCLVNLTWYLCVATALARPKARAVLARHERLLRLLTAATLCVLAVSNLSEIGEATYYGEEASGALLPKAP